MLFRVTEDVLDPRALEQELDCPENGAVVTFQGVVRNNSRGRAVSYLEYDAYAPMATKVMAQIAREIKDRWPVTDVGIWHRTGRLEIGEASLLVVVTAGHRKEAFEACHYCVDRIKEIVPVWKKEVCPDGESWIEGDVMVATGHDDHSEERTPTPEPLVHHAAGVSPSAWSEADMALFREIHANNAAFNRIREDYTRRYPGKWVGVVGEHIFGPADTRDDVERLIEASAYGHVPSYIGYLDPTVPEIVNEYLASFPE